MGAREQIQKKIEQKQEEIRELEIKIREAGVYIQALQDTVRLLPKEANDGQPEQVLRTGSLVYQAREAIKQAGRPLHISELLTTLGQPVDNQHRASLSGSISNYARRGEIFTRPAPNTFGLVEQKSKSAEPPEGFGAVVIEENE